MIKTHFDNLTVEDSGIHTLNGQPFTGVAHDEFSSGLLRSEATFVDGHQEGRCREWYENGQIKLDSEYLGNGKHGPYKEWHENGQIKTEGYCEFGICVNAEEWDNTGRIVKHYVLDPSSWSFQLLEKKRRLWSNGK